MEKLWQTKDNEVLDKIKAQLITTLTADIMTLTDQQEGAKELKTILGNKDFFYEALQILLIKLMPFE